MSLQKSYIEFLKIKTPPQIIWHKCNNINMMLDAINTKYVAGVEYDVMATSDKVPVLFHDKSIMEKMVNWKLVPISPIEVSKISFAELKQMRPDMNSLEEVLDAANKENLRDNFKFHLEIKPDDNNFTDKIMELLGKFPEINKRTIPRSFQSNVLVRIKDKYPDREVCLLLSGNSPIDDIKHFDTADTALEKLPTNIEDLKKILGGRYLPEYVSIDYKMLQKDNVTERFINAMKAAEIKLDVYTLNEPKFALGIKELGIDGIVTDEPQQIHQDLKMQRQR
jgi:glycerophosphoryl diester phosphodiesterase